jgi:uncharacterized protein (DUF697 family)/predicted GTPase
VTDGTGDAKKALSESLRRVEGILEALPSDAARDLKVRIANLRTLMLEQRPPAIVLVGRRGSGKSSLVNALVGSKVAELGHVVGQTGRGRWIDVTTDGGTLSVLDTRGVQEGSRPVEDDDAKTPLASILTELERKAPDVVLLVVRATDVDSAIEGDLDALAEVLRAADRTHRTIPPVIAAVTHADVLEPKTLALHAKVPEPAREGSAPDPDREEKLAHVRLAESTIEDKLRARPALAPHVRRAIAVSSYLSFRADGTVRADERWRIAELCEIVFAALPAQGKAAFARVSRVRALQDSIAKDLTRATATLCAGVAAIPIPIADALPLTTLQAGLVASIAYLSGRSFEAKTAAEFLGAIGMNVGAAFAMREAARALVKYLFPGAGSVVSAGVAFTGTMALGAAARAYFIWDEPIDRARKVFEDRKTRKDAERSPDRDE